MTDQIPAAISAFVAAANAAESDAFLAAFTDDAIVVDVQREFAGRAEIKRWSENEIFADNVVQEVESVREHYGDYIVVLKVDGDFDKTNLPDPLLLTGYFTLRGGQIARLIIIQVVPADLPVREVLEGLAPK
jgi:hypothetical protein